MKTPILLSTLCFFCISGFTQVKNTFEISLDNKLLAEITEDVSVKSPQIKINLKENYARNSRMRITKTSGNDQQGWMRKIECQDSSGNTLLKWVDGRTVGAYEVFVNDIKSKLQKGVVYLIYTWALPTDPDIAARVRIKRIHLCSLILE